MDIHQKEFQCSVKVESIKLQKLRTKFEHIEMADQKV